MWLRSNRGTCRVRRLLRFAATAFAWVGLAVALPARAQAAAGSPKLEFDVISIRQNKSGPAEQGGDASRVNIPNGPEDTFRATGGVYSAQNMPLISFISFAYKVTTSQRAVFRASVPQWAQQENFNIEARTDNHEVTKDQMRMMMRALLADRFKLIVHKETRETPVFAVVLVKPGMLGPHLRQHPADEPCSTVAPPLGKPGPDAAAPPPTTVAGGYPVICGGFARMEPTTPYLRHEGARNMPMGTIVTAFSGLGNLGRPAIDQTGLTGNFDFVMEFLQGTPGEDFPTDAAGPQFPEALKDQLGLKLVPQKSDFEFVLVDHLEHPSEN